ncbi:outer membrane beta-barrel protein [Fulvivirga sediminis]|uniref:Outer membrane beta-barrel protein n=1 Tax=Fulvivirga sediminis TaxID=2803949 RepID=A0A937JZF9_9BACT|nr:outer membrane beta-barrel protein [Fulvivirga sediminis]MBL3655240.1 outer membrane beta-barrel protein [Fulvivirga sediminis]
MNKEKLSRMKFIPFLGILTLAFFISTVSFGQGFYVRAGGGYSIKASSSQYNDSDPNSITGIEPSTRINVNQDGTTVESLKGTLGEGFKLGAVAGYMFNQYIGAELGVYYFHGSEQTIGETTTPLSHSIANAYIRGIDVAPAFVVTPGFEGINPYARVGLLIPVAGDLTIDTSVDQMNAGPNGETVMIRAESEVQPKFSVGYQGAIGVLFPVNSGFDIFTEVEFKSVSLRSDEAEIKSFRTTINGNPTPGGQLEDLPMSEKKFIFSDEFKVSENENEARTLPTQFVNASGIGLNVGVRYTF